MRPLDGPRPTTPHSQVQGRHCSSVPVLLHPKLDRELLPRLLLTQPTRLAEKDGAHSGTPKAWAGRLARTSRLFDLVSRPPGRPFLQWIWQVGQHVGKATQSLSGDKHCRRSLSTPDKLQGEVQGLPKGFFQTGFFNALLGFPALEHGAWRQSGNSIF